MKTKVGARLLFLRRLPQFNPIPVEVQAAVLWAVQNNFFDDVAVDKVKDFQNKLTDFLKTV